MIGFTSARHRIERTGVYYRIAVLNTRSTIHIAATMAMRSDPMRNKSHW
jgi:hypothetical protein